MYKPQLEMMVVEKKIERIYQFTEILMLLWENKNVSTKKILLERLFELASTEYQKIYIDNATTDKYTWGDELVNEIINPLELIQRPENKYLFDNNELLAIKEYKNKLDTICKNNNMDTDLYEMPEIWNKIVISSVNLLNLLGYSINDFDEDAKLIAEHKV